MDIQQLYEFIGLQWHLVAILLVLLAMLLVLLWREHKMAGLRVDPPSAVRLINKENALVIDLRDQAAFTQGHIVGAKNIPHTRLTQAGQELRSPKDRPLILVCDAGRLSASSGSVLRRQGFSRVYLLTGGVQNWRSSGLPLTSR